MGKRARQRKQARDAERILAKQIIPQILARHLTEQGYRVDALPVSTAPGAEGFTITCGGCGRTAVTTADPGAKFALCPDCIPAHPTGDPE